MGASRISRVLGRDAFVNIMEQYRPDAHVGKTRRSPSGEMKSLRYSEINRAVSEREMSEVQVAARKAGLWRFVEVAQHGGFNI